MQGRGARLAVALVAAAALSGCGVTRDLGKPPELSTVGSGVPGAMPGPLIEPKYPGPALNKYSTWDDRSASLFTARKALTRGDTLTVRIEIQDRARVRSDSERSRTTGRSWRLGGDYDVSGVGGEATGNASLGGQTDFDGAGATSRSETISLRIAAFVVDVLENGHLVIKGTQEIRVNAEVRVLTVAGIVRPSDIDPSNTVDYDRIAEARISYGGKGHIAEMQQPPYGHQLIDRLSPF
ncbi:MULTISPECIES: flagellar basal body L-ring protein FlgH [unclassified Roseitalea]|uniref:flagellar basal body L-ring protein FlgH n=1 Tax=unclassified Roseitalea TaxID=2639107 RepID=UPI00273E9251|nr:MULTISPECIES: flagellar basal body L-ring protein FlgH [unclassified Roseitalea]